MSARTFRSAVVVVAVASWIVAAPAASQAAQLTVDDNATDCPAAGFTSIQTAITAATAGDIISICPGTYTSPALTGGSGLLVNKPLTIRGAGADLVTIRPPAGTIGDGIARNTIGNVISVTAGPTSISGVGVDGNGGGLGTADAGVVFMLDASGSSLTNSRVTLGQQVGTSGTGIGVEALSQVTTGIFTFTLTGNQIDRYSKAGVLIDSGQAPPLFSYSGSQVNATVRSNTIRGGGPSADVPQGQNGIQVSRGARAAIGSATALTGNQIELNRSCTDTAIPGCDARQSDGILIFDQPTAATYNQTTVIGNNIQGNGFGLLATDASFAAPPPATTAINATNNYWGDPAGPTPTDVTTAVPASDNGDRVNLATQGVNFTGFANTPFSIAPTPATQPDAPPGVSITNPSYGATLQPGVPVTVTATATDDIGVKVVTFRKGTFAFGSATVPTAGVYSATYTPTADEAGSTQAITVTAVDSRGQSTATATSVQIAGPTPTPTPTTPATTPEAAPIPAPIIVTPPLAEDNPPKVSFASPKSNAKLKANKTTALRATASDDKGVASVTFYAGTRQLCKDTSSPYSCNYKPRNSDAGTVTLLAIATDKAGQTSTALRSVRVTKKKRRR